MRSKDEIEDMLERRESRLQYGSWKQDHVEIETLEWVLGYRDEMPEARFDDDERVGSR